MKVREGCAAPEGASQKEEFRPFSEDADEVLMQEVTKEGREA